MEDEEYDALMRTPTGLDFEAAAATFGVLHHRVSDLSQLPAAFASGSAVLEIPIDP
jgi:2-succinyl-5-enolpyruvyl-6-hydroxy-3-cyclohexene-1-carboxylate synthase